MQVVHPYFRNTSLSFKRDPVAYTFPTLANVALTSAAWLFPVVIRFKRSSLLSCLMSLIGKPLNRVGLSRRK